MLLEECKYVVKEKKVSKYIIYDIEISILSPEENSDEKIFKYSYIKVSF